MEEKDGGYIACMRLCVCVDTCAAYGPKLFVVISVTGVRDSDKGHEATMDAKVFQKFIYK